MRRGTTPTHRFHLPVNESGIKQLEIVYLQDGEKVLEKEKRDCTFDGNTALLKLEQDETFLFSAACKAMVQVRVLTTDGTVMGSEVATITVKESLSDEVLI